MERFGVSVALLTPFSESGQINLSLLSEHANKVLADGADSVTLYGTTGEGASICLAERAAGIDALLSAGCSANAIVLGICATSVGDAVAQVQQGVDAGIDKFLLLPPFYFKGCDDTGLFHWHSDLLALTDESTRFILYHIPQVSGIDLSVQLVKQLCSIAPTRFMAIKDSSGNWETALSFLTDQPLPVLIGDERLLHRAVAKGAVGAISGMANLYPSRLQQIIQTATEDTALSEEVSRIVSVPVIPALKALLASRSNHSSWGRVRPPLIELSSDQRSLLV